MKIVTRPTTHRPTVTDVTADQSDCGFLVLELGGAGSAAGDLAHEIRTWEQCRVPVERIQFDLDKSQRSTAAHRVDLSLSPQNAAELLANAPLFGPDVVRAISHIGHLLHPMELEAGARTTRGVAQCALRFHERTVVREIGRAISRLKKHHGVKRIVPVEVHSNGGGSGSALSILLPLLVQRWTVHAQLRAGFAPDLLETPVSVTAFPYSYARNYATDSQATKILSNQYAWEREMDLLLYQQAASYVLSVGYSNSAGRVLDTAERMVRVLAISAHHFMVNFAYFKARWVDSMPSPREAHYRGIDTPERLFPSVRALSQKFYPEEDV